LRKAAAKIRVGRRLHEHALIILSVPDRCGIAAVIPVNSHMVGQEEPDRCAGEHLHRQSQHVEVGGRSAADGDEPAMIPVNPAAAFWCHLKGRRDVQQVPTVRPFNEETLTMAAQETQITMGGG
jgi:hypothetical protein